MTDLPPRDQVSADKKTPETGEASKTSFLRSTAIVSSLTMLSRVLGLVRDMVVANFFGASAGSDVFFLAFKIPNFFRRLFGEGAFSQAFIPVLTEYKSKRSHADVRALISHVSGALGSSLLVFTLIGVLAAPLVIGLFAMGFVYSGETAKLTLAAEMLRLTFPYVLLICMTAFAGAVLNSYQRFAVPAFTPVLLNISLISCALFLSPRMDTPVMALGWGVLIAGVLQFSFQLPFLARQNLLVWPRIKPKDEGVSRVMTLMLPAIFGVSVGQINLLLDTVLASFLETGSLSWLYYSDRLLELPLALFGITIATVILPSLSQKSVNSDAKAFSDTLSWAIRTVCLIGFPASVALVVLAEPLITTLFYRGEMSARDVQMAALSLQAYGLGLLGHMLVKVLAPGFYSRQDTKTPVKFALVALVANMVFNLILVWQFKHVGLALATSLSAFLNAGLLWWGLARDNIIKFDAAWLKYAIQLVLANGLMLVCLLYIMPLQEEWLLMDFWRRFGLMLIICVGGAMVYLLGLLLLGFRYKDFVK